MYKRFYIIIFVSCSLSVFAQKTYNFTLQQAIDYGLSNSLTVQREKLEADIQREKAFEVVTTGFPTIKATGEYSWYFKRPVQIIPANSFAPGSPPEDQETFFIFPNNLNLSVELNQLLFDARYFYGLKALKAFRTMSDHIEENARIQAVESITKAYYSVVVAKEAYHELKKNEAVLQKLLYETQKTYESGFTDELAVNRLELNVANLRTQIQSAQTRIENAMLNLKQTIGLEHTENLTLTENLETFVEKMNTEVSEKGNASDRIELKMLTLQEELRTYNTKQLKANNYPSLFATGRYALRGVRNRLNEAGDWAINYEGMLGVVLNIPIFDGLTARSQAQQSELVRQQIAGDAENFKQSFHLQVRVAKNNLLNAMNTFQTQKENLSLAQKIYDKTNIMFSEGIGTSYELSQAQADLTTTIVNYSQSIFDLLVAELELNKALGKL